MVSPNTPGPQDATRSSADTPSIPDVVIRLAGNSQDGIQAVGGFLARLAGRSDQEVMTYMTIPSTISGGPSIFQVRMGSGEMMGTMADPEAMQAKCTEWMTTDAPAMHANADADAWCGEMAAWMASHMPTTGSMNGPMMGS